jgi:hypothetical protein
MRPVSLALPPKLPTALAFYPPTGLLTWTDNSITETEFVVLKSTNGTDWVEVGALASPLNKPNTHGSRSMKDSSYNPKKTTIYRVAAVNTVGYGGAFPSMTVQSISKSLTVTPAMAKGSGPKGTTGTGCSSAASGHEASSGLAVWGVLFSLFLTVRRQRHGRSATQASAPSCGSPQRPLMFTKTLPFAGLLLLTSCYSESSYDEDLTAAVCDWTVHCYPDLYADADACIAAGVQGEETGSNCSFHAKAARDCVAAWQEASCPAKGETTTWPSVCAGVFTNCKEDSSSDSNSDTGAGGS